MNVQYNDLSFPLPSFTLLPVLTVSAKLASGFFAIKSTISNKTYSEPLKCAIHVSECFNDGFCNFLSSLQFI